MKGMVTIAALVAMVLLGSCSWKKHSNPALATPATTQRVEPTPAQQEAAKKLLSEREKKTEPSLGEVPEPATEAAPTEASAEAPEGRPLMIRDPQSATYRAMDEGVGDDDTSPDPAQQRGLRSPALPKLLPMDINGKINPGL